MIVPAIAILQFLFCRSVQLPTHYSSNSGSLHMYCTLCFNNSGSRYNYNRKFNLPCTVSY